jgi:AraC-like DNA-binding protein
MAITQHAAVLGTFWKLIESYGKDPDPIFRKLYLDPKLAENPNARIPYAKIEAFWLEIIALIDDPGIGLKAAELWHPSSSGSLGYAWLASSSLRTAFVRLVRYLRVVTEGMQCRIEEKNGEFALIHAFHKDSLNIPQHADAVLATITSLCRINYGQSLQPVAVSFTHPEPADSGAYFAFFRCPVYFNTADNRIILSQDAVNKRLPSSNPLLAQLHDQIMVEYMAQLDDDNIIERIKAAIIDQLPSGQVTDSSIADALYLSRRTFHRRLLQQNTTFRAILNEVRQKLASQYITDSSLSLNEISFLLGFAEISSFSRAFKRWTGTSPSAFRT